MTPPDVALIDLAIVNRYLLGSVPLMPRPCKPATSDKNPAPHSRRPSLVVRSDILQFDLDRKLVVEVNVSLYSERFLHAAYFAARPDLTCVSP